MYQVESELARQPDHGEVCLGEWVYHVHPRLASTHHRALAGATRLTHTKLRFTVQKHTGDVAMVMRVGRVLLKLVPPYTAMSAATVEESVDSCYSTAAPRRMSASTG